MLFLQKFTRRYHERPKFFPPQYHFSMFQKEINFDRFVRGIMFLAAIVVAYLLLDYLSAVLIPFFAAWIVAYILFPIVDFFQNKCHLRSRLLSILVTVLLIGGVIFGIMQLIWPVIVEQVGHIKEVASRYMDTMPTNSSIPAAVQNFINKNAESLSVENLLREHDVQNFLKNAMGKVWSFAWSTVGIIVSILSSLIALIYLFFLLLDYEKFANGWMEFVPVKQRPIVGQVVNDVVNSMSRYFRGQVLVALSYCVMFSLGFWIIGFPSPLALGLFIGIISFVPYLQLIGFVPATILALLQAAETNSNFWMLMGGVVLVYLVAQILQDMVFTPRIMGKFMGLNPAITLLALSVWGYLLGMLGLIIALPATTLIISYYKRYVIGTEPPVETQKTEDTASTQA